MLSKYFYMVHGLYFNFWLLPAYTANHGRGPPEYLFPSDLQTDTNTVVQ